MSTGHKCCCQWRLGAVLLQATQQQLSQPDCRHQGCSSAYTSVYMHASACLVLVAILVPVNIQCIMQPVVHKVRQPRCEIPISDVGVVDDCVDAHGVCGVVSDVKHEVMQLWPVTVSKTNSPKECLWSLLLQQGLKLLVVLEPVLV